MNNKEKYTKRKLIRSWILMIILVVAVFFLSVFIFNTDYLSPKVDELTASYISFNNVESTDIIKVSNIKKMNDTNGKSYKNKSSVSFNVNGKKGTNYEVVLYPIGTILNNCNVKFYLENNVDKITNNLNNMDRKVDDGIVVYKSTIGKEGKFKLKLWVDDSCDEKFKNLSYEVKVKLG